MLSKKIRNGDIIGGIAYYKLIKLDYFSRFSITTVFAEFKKVSFCIDVNCIDVNFEGKSRRIVGMKIGTFFYKSNSYIIVINCKGEFWGISKIEAFHSRTLLIEKKKR